MVIEEVTGKKIVPFEHKNNEAIILKRITPTNSITKGSLGQFATELDLPIDLLIKQLNNAGVNKFNHDDQLTEADKTTLLNYLRKENGAEVMSKSKITLMRQTQRFEKKLQPKNIYEVIEKVRAKQDRLNAKKASKSVEDSDGLRNRYFAMSEVQLLVLWNNGNNDFEEDERKIIRAALKQI